jgi:hypothetical protein
MLSANITKFKKYLYIIMIIYIIVKFMGEKELEKLYEDAIYWHLIGKGYSEKQAELEAKRRMLQQNEL